MSITDFIPFRPHQQQGQFPKKNAENRPKNNTKKNFLTKILDK